MRAIKAANEARRALGDLLCSATAKVSGARNARSGQRLVARSRTPPSHDADPPERWVDRFDVTDAGAARAAVVVKGLPFSSRG